MTGIFKPEFGAGPARPIYIASEIFRKSRYGGKHPLSIPRVSLATDLVRALGWLPPAQYRDGPIATPAQLARFHDPDYIDALWRAETVGLSDADKDLFNIGRGGNPIYGEVYRRPATAAGSSILAAELVRDGGTVHSPAGGTHHGRRDRASGFCYLNDPVLAILTLMDAGVFRIAYVDLDAHHGDGVEDAFADNPDILTISVHEAGRWPHSGDCVGDTRTGIMNIPVPAGFNDDEFLFVLEAAVLPTVEAFLPEAIIVQCGVDGLADDPMSGLMLSNRVFPTAVSELTALSPRRIILGGGGYNPYALARAWAAIWGVLDGQDMPDRLPEAARSVLAEIEWRHSRAQNPPSRWFDTLLDPPSHGPIRDSVRDLVRIAGSKTFESHAVRI